MKTCDSSQNPDNDGPIDKVANWFKDIFNVCGKSSCCSSKNPYYDKKTWGDINDRISYKNNEASPAKTDRHTT